MNGKFNLVLVTTLGVLTSLIGLTYFVILFEFRR